MPAYAGQIADPAQYDNDTRKLVARAARITDTSTTTTGELAVLRADGIPLKAGRFYWITTSTLLLVSSANGDGIRARLRASTTGTATTSDTEIAQALVQTLTGQGSASGICACPYYPASDTTLSIVLTVVRVQGTGNVKISVVNSLIDFQVFDCGVDVGNIGVTL